MGIVVNFASVAILLVFFILFLRLRKRALSSKESDLETIRKYCASHDFLVQDIRDSEGHLGYWLKGRLDLSNVSRIYVITGISPEGQAKEIHVFFDPTDDPRALKVLAEKAIGP